MNRFLLCLTAAMSVSLAQQNAPPPIQSPEVHPDGRVTFRLRAPDAQKVAVRLEGRKDPLVMQKDEQGVWAVTTDPLTPEIYGYSLDIDGHHLLDPYNTEIKPNLLNLSNVVHVTGATPQPWDMQDIPHGIVHHHFYTSAIIGDKRDFYVYTPPGYDPKSATLYPVLYLLHGYSDDASGWTAVGKANLILDSLIAQGKARPMLVVMPLGYGAPEVVRRPTPGGSPLRNAGLWEKNLNNFRAALIDEVIPAVEKTYRVDPNRDARAIAGLSMGGAESLFTGLNRLDKFSWIGAFSSGGLNGDFAGIFPQLTSSANAQLHLLWIACGTEDNLITGNRNLVTWLKGKDIHLTPIETPGMHTWMVWRNNLTEFTPLLFRTGATTGSPTETAKQ